MFKSINTRSKRKAFTLLELIIATVILAVLAAFAIPTLVSDTAGASNARDLTSLTAMANDVRAIATSGGTAPSVAPSAANVATALSEMQNLPNNTLWVGVPTASTGYGIVSYDVTDAPDSAGYAMQSQAGACVMALTIGNTTTSWNAGSVVGGACSGSLALSGQTTTPTTVVVHYSTATCGSAVSAAEAFMTANRFRTVANQLATTGSSPFTALHDAVTAACPPGALNAFHAGAYARWTSATAQATTTTTPKVSFTTTVPKNSPATFGSPTPPPTQPTRSTLRPVH